MGRVRAVAGSIRRRIRRVLHPSPGALIPHQSQQPRSLAQRLLRIVTLEEYRHRRTHVIETSRLIIRPSVPSDADGLVATIDKQVIAQHGWMPGHEEKVHRAVVRSENHGQSLLVHKASNRIVGAMGITLDPEKPDQIDLGLWVSGDMRASGIANEASQAVTRRLHELGWPIVTAETRDSNRGALLLMKRNGYVTTGETTKTLDNGEVVTYIIGQHRPDN
jgi:RimJ/RimL family protein N-acetyltransferase